MSDPTSQPDDAVDRWLADQRRAVADDLAATLDLEAGLREAMIPARHADLVADLRDVLDVEAGLSAIVSATPADSAGTHLEGPSPDPQPTTAPAGSFRVIGPRVGMRQMPMADSADRRGLTELVNHCLRPPKSDRRRPLPIVLVWSPRMSGKSELLDHLHEYFYPGRPCVRLNGHELGALRPHEVAVQFAFHLGRRVKRFGRLRFPRLFLGVAAIRGPVAIDDPAITRSMMIRRTIPDHRRLRSLARETVIDLADVVGASQDTRFFLGLQVEGVGALVETTLALSGQGRKWYQDGLGQHFTDPIDALVQLAMQEENPQLRKRVDEVLCRAFLADLRDAYSPRSLQLFKRDENCLAILHDADSEGARGFLEILAAQRQDWDPLLIVGDAATRSPFVGHQYPEYWVVRDAVHATYEDWNDARAVNDGWTAVYPIELSGLTLDEARAHFAGKVPPLYGPEVDVTGVLGNTEKALRFAHRLTGGHIGGMRLVLAAMSLERRRVGAENVDVRSLFSRPTTPDGQSLAQEAQLLLLGGWSVEMRRALVRSTAARDFGKSSLAVVLQNEPDPVAHMMRSFRSRDLWVRHPPKTDDANPPTLHPFPRRGVLHLLAEPSGPEEPTWDDVHNQLRTHAEKQGDQTSAMYHRLALGDVAAVAKHLSILFASEDAAKWYATLTAITQAPLAHPAREADSRQHLLRLVQKVDDGLEKPAALVELVAALQLHTDPLGDPGHHLCIVIAEKLEHIALHSKEFFYLLEQAEEFRRCWERWYRD
ncbi:MAG: hypothetical protein ACT4NY_08890 [Pseudonocardiales bacterium]